MISSEQIEDNISSSTVTIQSFRAYYPFTLEVIITAQDGSQQYQLHTRLEEDVEDLTENINSPEWMIVPPRTREFKLGDKMETQCKTFIKDEKDTYYMSEMVMFQGKPIRRDNKTLVFYDAVAIIRKDVGNFKEENEGTTYIARRERLNQDGDVTYDLEVRVDETSMENRGIYMCQMERENDKAFYLSSTNIENGASLYPSAPYAELRVCHDGQPVNDGDEIAFWRKREYCLRCQGLGYPQPNVAIYRGNVELTDQENISVFKFINVADGGIPEAIYLFLDPLENLNGNYPCRATNENGSDQLNFQIRYDNRFG